MLELFQRIAYIVLRSVESVAFLKMVRGRKRRGLIWPHDGFSPDMDRTGSTTSAGPLCPFMSVPPAQLPPEIYKYPDAVWQSLIKRSREEISSCKKKKQGACKKKIMSNSTDLYFITGNGVG